MMPDDVCVLCNTTREDHGDKAHLFSLDGVLKPKAKGEPPRNTPPRERGASAFELPDSPTGRALIRLIEVLVERGQLKPLELVYIFGGVTLADNRRGPNEATEGNSSS